MLEVDDRCMRNSGDQHSFGESANILGTPTARLPQHRTHEYNRLATSALPLRDPWSLVPSLGNLDAYVSAVNRIPMLTHEQEAGLRAPAARPG